MFTITIINIIIFFIGLIVGGQGGPGEEDSWGASQASWNLSTHPSSSSSRSSSPPSSWIISNILSTQAFLLHPQACLRMPLLKQPQCCSSDSLGAQVNRIPIIGTKNQPNYKQTNAQCYPLDPLIPHVIGRHKIVMSAVKDRRCLGFVCLWLLPPQLQKALK